MGLSLSLKKPYDQRSKLSRPPESSFDEERERMRLSLALKIHDKRSKLSPPAESSSDDELMPLPKPTTLFEPYDDDTTNSHSEEESGDPKPQKPSSNSEKKNLMTSHPSLIQKNSFIHPQPSILLMMMRYVSHLPHLEDEEDDISSGKAVKILFERLFTEQNEITVLDKINDYITKNAPYDDDTSDSDLEEEFDDPKPQKPCSYSVAEESSDETSERSHSLASSTTNHVVVVQKLETPTTVVGSKKLKEVVVSKGIHDYIIKNGGKDPLNDIDKFFQVINDSLQQEESDDSKLQKSCSYSEEEEYGDETSDTNSENSIHPPSN
ncbi:hypothetical protein ACFE04_021130 [Oxalis oulophora]